MCYYSALYPQRSTEQKQYDPPKHCLESFPQAAWGNKFQSFIRRCIQSFPQTLLILFIPSAAPNSAALNVTFLYFALPTASKAYSTRCFSLNR